MGEPLNPKVKVSINNEVAKYAKIRIDPTVDSFVFCVSRSPKDELCMAYAVVAPSEDTLAEFLYSSHHLKNVLDDFKVAKAQENDYFEAFSAKALDRGEIPPPVMRSCCEYNRNVPIYVVQHDNNGSLKSTVLFNKFIHAIFPDKDAEGNPIKDPLKRHLTSMEIREVLNPNSPKPDSKCQLPAAP